MRASGVAFSRMNFVSNLSLILWVKTNVKYDAVYDQRGFLDCAQPCTITSIL